MDNYMNMGYNPMLRNYNGFYNRPMNQQQEVNIKGNTVWVQGYEDASAFRMEPNSVFVLLQNDLKKAYIKTTDNDVDCELKKAEQYHLNKVAIGYNMEGIIAEQHKKHKKYKEKMKCFHYSLW